MNLRSSWVAETGQTREDTRLNQIGATTPVNPVQVRSGILPGSYGGLYRLSGFWTEGTALMSVTVHEGRAVIQGDISQGVYPVSLTTPVVLTVAPGTDQPRKDLVVIRIYDNLYDGQLRQEAKVEIMQGAPGSPDRPVAPPRSLPLCEITVPANASAGTGGIQWNTALKDLRTPVVSIGGILPVEGEILPGGYPGQYQDTANNQLQRWDGGKWVAYPEALGGIVPTSAGNVSGSYVGQYRDNTGGWLQRWDGATWKPAVMPGPYFTDSSDWGDTSSSTYTSTLDGRTNNPFSLTFTAPPSKNVLVTFGSRIRSRNDLYAYMALKLTQGATLVQDTNDEWAAICASDNAISTSTTRRLTGLTPGLSYTLTAFFRVVANTAGVKGGFDNTFIRVDPQF
ncbi:hypothetical protein ACFY8W_10390 [Streptomyces sp. NPDC012637]|uniref:hypothetical protein n=1 Tax=Streptomyces sp. NPDC012637 TaxID=3364842 RepID=UPI0036E98328